MNEEKERNNSNNSNKTEKPRTRRNPLFYVFALIFAAAVIFGIVYYIKVKIPQNKRGKVYDELAEAVEKTPTPEPTATPAPPTATLAPDKTATPTPEPTKAPVDIPVSFEEAWKTNEDIYAWIRIYDQNSEEPKYILNYPVLQSPMTLDDSYYLNHTVNHKSGLPGSIYTKRVNNKDFSDHITVIYGHNMANGTMFGVLNKFVSKAFADTNNEIVIYTPEHILTYEIFAGVTYDNRLITTSFDVRTEKGLSDFLDSLRNVRNWKTYWRDSVEVDGSDRVLVLSTCNGNKQQRFLVLAVLKDEQ